MNRRTCLGSLSALGFLHLMTGWSSMEAQILQRTIPSSNAKIPAVGLGTWQTFDVGEDESARAPLRSVLQTLVGNGGSVIDSSPMYGNSEKVAGDLSSELGINEKLFIATKVWTRGREAGIQQMNNSFSLLKRKRIDLMQIHNLVDWEVHYKTLREWKEAGKIQYIGITHYTEGAYGSIEQIMKTNPLDFIQINYSVLSRSADERLFPLAQEKKVAVLVNQPFESGSLFTRVKGKTLPALAKELDCNSWGQLFLKFILAQPAVTCVIPGTSKPHHMLDNLQAGLGKLPSANQRAQIVNLVS